MKRLRDLEGDPLIERAAALLRAAEPLPESSERMARIRQTIDAQPRVVRRSRLRPAVWIGAGGLLAGAAAAATGQLWVPKAPLVHPSAVVSTMHAPSESAEPETLPAPSGTRSAHRRVRARTRVKGRATTRPGRVNTSSQSLQREEERAPTPDSSARAAEAALVHSAVIALRREGNPEKAARLLRSYAASYPNGPLAEEALSLRIEAAMARGAPGARRLARQYLSRYPHGRYRDAAKRALAGSQ